jgi:hypothetical protein
MSLRLGLLWFLLVWANPQFAQIEPNTKIKNEEARKLFREGWNHSFLGDMGQARFKFQKANSLEPNSFPIINSINTNSFLDGNWKEGQDRFSVYSQSENSFNHPGIQSKNDFWTLLFNGQNKESEWIFNDTMFGSEYRGFRFKYPVSVKVDERNHLYVLGAESRNLLSFTANHKADFQMRGGFLDRFEYPVEFIILEKEIWVSDYKKDMIFVYDRTGSLVRKFGKTGSGKDQFRGPLGMAHDEEKVYIVDSGNSRILSVTHEGLPISEFEKSGKASLLFPSHIILHNNQLYVSDKGNKRIAIFHPDGFFLNEIKNPEIVSPRGMYIRSNTLYIADEQSGVLMYNLLDNSITKWPRFKDGEGLIRNFDRPYSITFDLFENFYVADAARHRVDIFAKKSVSLSNVYLMIEKVETLRYPEIDIFFRFYGSDGNPVQSMERNYFTLLEKGKRTPLAGLTALGETNDDSHMVWVFQPDSQWKKNLEHYKSHIIQFIRNFHEGDTFDLYRSGKENVILSKESIQFSETVEVMNQSPIEEESSLGKSLYLAGTSLLAKKGRRVVFLQLSHTPNEKDFDLTYLTKIQRFFKANEISLFIVTSKEDPIIFDPLDRVMKDTNGERITIPTDAVWKEIFHKLSKRRDSRYILSYKTLLSEDFKGDFVPITLSGKFRGSVGIDWGGYFVP